MNYFAIGYSMKTKIVGKMPQIKEVMHNCHVWDEPRFIDRMYFQKIEGMPILSNAVLFPKAKLTDFIATPGMGFSHGSMLISYNLKNILEQFKVFGLQYFKTFLIHNNEKIENYWQTHKTKFAFDVIDFEKSEIYLNNSEKMKIDFSNKLIYNNVEDFEQKILEFNYPFHPAITKLHLIANMNLDFFSLRYFENEGSYGIVSENLKNEIENQGITGIEFRPIEISLQDWLRSEEREKIYGKI